MTDGNRVVLRKFEPGFPQRMDWYQWYYPFVAAACPVLPVCYRPVQPSDSCTQYGASWKDHDIFASWKRLNLPVRAFEPRALCREELYLVHVRDFIDGSLTFDNSVFLDGSASAGAESAYWSAASMTSAAEAAVRNGVAAGTPVSGMNDGGIDRGDGVLTLNGMLTAAAVLKARGLVRRVGILDADQIEGDATRTLIDRLGLDWVEYWPLGRLCPTYQKSSYFCFLQVFFKQTARPANCDLIIYQSGANPRCHPGGQPGLSRRELRSRDAIVFTLASEAGIPVAWCLGGNSYLGMGSTLSIHDATLVESVRTALGEGAVRHLAGAAATDQGELS